MSLLDRTRLQALRDALLNLHKALVDSERVAYEQAFGTIPNAQEFLKLLLQDPWFAWLKPLSELIVSLDEALDDPTDPLNDEPPAWLARTRQLLVASETGEGFPQHYFNALQRDPDVVMAHASVAALLGRPASAA